MTTALTRINTRGYLTKTKSDDVVASHETVVYNYGKTCWRYLLCIVVIAANSTKTLSFAPSVGRQRQETHLRNRHPRRHTVNQCMPSQYRRREA